MRTALIWSATWLLTASASPALAQQQPASISGHVTDAASTPVGRYSVVIFPTDRSQWSSNSRVVRVVLPAPDGSFEATSLLPGEYWVAAIEPRDVLRPAGEWVNPEILEQLSLRATRVTLAERQRLMTVLRLIRK
jgi:hypothetical protein